MTLSEENMQLDASDEFLIFKVQMCRLCIHVAQVVFKIFEKSKALLSMISHCLFELLKF